VPTLALGDAFRRAGLDKVFWRYDAHLTPYGHQAAADALYPFLVGLMRGDRPAPARR
jgi:hypothetical protein